MKNMFLGIIILVSAHALCVSSAPTGKAQGVCGMREPLPYIVKVKNVTVVAILQCADEESLVILMYFIVLMYHSFLRTLRPSSTN